MNDTFLKGKTVLITGRSGFLGSHLSNILSKKYGAKVIGRLLRHFDQDEPRYGEDLRSNVDLTVQKNVKMTISCWPATCDYCFHLAGFNGGIAFNLKKQADIFLRNTLMGLNVLDACRRHGVKKVVSVVASCAYPELELAPPEYAESLFVRREVMREDDFLDGPPHASVACHGYAKRNLQLASQFLNQQYGLRAVTACPTTLYGPGDSYDPERTKVVGGLMKRFADAARSGQQEVVCWGSGRPMREVLYVEDAAELLVQTMLSYEDSTQPLNLGSGQEYSIRELAEATATTVKFNGEIRWDTTKPDGQYRKRLDLTRMMATLPGVEYTSLTEGLSRTFADYLKRYPT